MQKAVLLFVIFIILVCLSLPIVFSMGIVTVFSFLGEPRFMTVIVQKLFSSIDNFTYLSIPLFILAAEIMSQCQLTQALVKVCNAFIGHIRGGLALVNILGSMLFAGVSGSASADTSGLGKVEIDIMTKAGYDRVYSTTCTVASSILGPIIPPSNVFIIYAAAAGQVSIAAMFMAGILPGILLGSLEMFICYIIAVKNNHPRSPKTSWREKGLAVWESAPVLVLPIIILGGIILGIFTAVESAAIAVIYAIIISLFRKMLTLKSFYMCLLNAAKMAGTIMLIIAVASMMGYAITILRIPQVITEFFVANIHTRTMFLLVINVLLLLLGTILDQSPALLLTVPVLFPIAQMYGIHPVHFGLIVCLNLTIGLITPPVGMQLFIGANVGKIKLAELFKSIWPFVGVCVVVLALVTYIPQISLFIPSLLGYIK